MCVSMFMYIYMCDGVCVFMCLCICVAVCAGMHIYMLHAHMYKNTCMCVYACVCARVYMCVDMTIHNYAHTIIIITYTRYPGIWNVTSDSIMGCQYCVWTSSLRYMHIKLYAYINE